MLQFESDSSQSSKIIVRSELVDQSDNDMTPLDGLTVEQAINDDINDDISTAQSLREERIKWEKKDKSFSDLHSQIKDGKYNLDPEHQRQVVHNDKWKSNVIHSAIYDGDIPDVYFHPVNLSNGTRQYDSLDGKQRKMAICDFFNNKFKYTNNEPACMKGRYFKDLSPSMQCFLKDDCSITIRIANRTLSNNEIESFFQKRQETKKTNIGEHLNSCVSSKINSSIKEYISNNENRDKMKAAGFTSNDRYQYTEALAVILRIYKHYTNERIECSNNNLRIWFKSEENQDPSDINKAFQLVNRVLEMLTRIKITNGNNKKNAYSSVAWYIMNYCYFKEGDVFNDAKIDVIGTKLSACEKIDLPKVDGNHSSQKQRDMLKDFIEKLMNV